MVWPQVLAPGLIAFVIGPRSICTGSKDLGEVFGEDGANTRLGMSDSEHKCDKTRTYNATTDNTKVGFKSQANENNGSVPCLEEWLASFGYATIDVLHT